MGEELMTKELDKKMSPIVRLLEGYDKDEVAEFVEGLVVDGLVGQNGTLTFAANKPGGKLQRDDLAMRVVMFLYDFKRNPYNPATIYFKRHTDDTYRSIDKDDPEIQDVVVSVYKELYHITPASEISSTVKNVVNNIIERADLGSPYLKLATSLYWDRKEGIIIDELPKGKEVYYQLFNSPISSNVPEIDANLEFGRTVHQRYLDVWQDWLLPHFQKGDTFESFYKELPMEYEFIKVWADPTKPGFIDRYWDLLLAIVPNFMYKKPPVAYFLLGNARGGKSSYVKMLHLMFGSNNTSTVRLNELGDPHLNLRLSSTLLNAPDEEMEANLTAKDMANFKSLAAHEQLELPVLYRTNPQKILPDFMMYLPSNALPKFTGSGAEACMRRARVMMFTADLSKLDHLPKDFLRETFTNELMASLLGTVLAFAKYFTTEMFWYSKTMQGSNDYVSQSVNSSKLYYDAWSKFFDGFETFSLVWDDYERWCYANDYRMEPRESLKARFFNELKSRVSVRKDGSTSKVYRIPNNKNVLTLDFDIEKCGDVKGLHGEGRSAVDTLTRLYEAELEKSVMSQAGAKAELLKDLGREEEWT